MTSPPLPVHQDTPRTGGTAATPGTTTLRLQGKSCRPRPKIAGGAHRVRPYGWHHVGREQAPPSAVPAQFGADRRGRDRRHRGDLGRQLATVAAGPARGPG